MHRLTELNFRFDFTLSSWRSWRDFMQSTCLAPMQQHSTSSWSMVHLLIVLFRVRSVHTLNMLSTRNAESTYSTLYSISHIDRFLSYLPCQRSRPAANVLTPHLGGFGRLHQAERMNKELQVMMRELVIVMMMVMMMMTTFLDTKANKRVQNHLIGGHCPRICH